jgi:hypothetical protein
MNDATAVFAAGNVLTGKGNIKDSLTSGTEIGTIVAESYLGLSDVEIPIAGEIRKQAHAEGEKIARAIEKRKPLAPEQVEKIRARVRERQRAIGYEGGYRAWIAKTTPPDLQ